MEKTHIVLDPAYKIAEVDPRIFGGFLEHMGRAVYEGVFDPKSSHSDENGFRKDVLDALRRLRLTAASLCRRLRSAREKRVSSFRRSRLPPSPLEQPDCLSNGYQNHLLCA